MAMAGIHTHYDTLQVSENASDEVIRGAYRYLSQKWHPDKNPDNPEEAKRVMARLNEAYAVLSDPKRRQEHDAWIAEQRAAGAPGGNGGGTNGKAPPDSGSKSPRDAISGYGRWPSSAAPWRWAWPPTSFHRWPAC
jgi:DnaJ-class molecular chaperone